MERDTCIKGLIGPALEPKTESCFSPINIQILIGLLEEKKQVENSGIYLRNFYRCYGSKNGRHNRLKIEKLPF